MGKIFTASRTGKENEREKLKGNAMNKNDILKIIAILILISAGLFAQNKVTIKGKVIDSQKRPLPYVNVFITNTSDGTMSGDDGRFDFTTKQKGKVILSASMVGYKTANIELDLNSLQDNSFTIEL